MTTPAPPILRTAVVARPVDEAFAVFTDEIGAWWPLPTHSIFQGEAGGVHFVGDRLIERATDGRENVWAEVLAWEPPQRLVLAWHPGSSDGPAGRVEVRFTAEDGGTRVDLRHDGWEAFGDAAMKQRRTYAGPSAWGHVLDHFADGVELRLDGGDLSALESAYAAFFDEAEAGAAAGFAAPTDGGWTAEQVVAHVALNDLALTAVAHALVHRDDQPTFGNNTCQVIENLDAVVADCGDLTGLIAHGRRCATQAIAAARRLDPDQRDQPVSCTFEHDGEVVGEGPMPWGQVAIEVQAARHLPAHIEQLQKLRA
ncbi:MAG: SRPBCC domain-containing protein [Actinomycetota bacterium]